MKQFYVASFFFLSILLIFNSCNKKAETTSNIPKYQIEKFKDVLALVKKETLKERKIQMINSFLKKIEKTEYDSLLYKTLMFKTSLHSKNKQLDSAIYFSNRLYTISQKNNDSLYMAKALTKLGHYYKSKNELTLAFKNYNESFKISKSLKNNIEAGKRLFGMSNIQKDIGDFVGSKATAIDGVEFLKGTDELKYISGLYHTISIALKEEGKYGDALEFNARALKLANNNSKIKKIRKYNILIFKNTKANILREENKFKAAIFIYDELLKDSIVINNTIEYARVLDNKGYTLWLENNDNKESLNLMLKALEIRNKNNYTNGLIASNIHLSKCLSIENKSQALQYAESAYNKAKSIGAMDDILEALDYIFHLRTKLKIPINNLALDYSNTAIELRKLKSETREIYVTNKYDNDELIRNNEKEKSLRIITFIVLAFVLLLFVFVYLFLKSKHKKEKLQQVYTTETRISKKVHDEVANDMYQVMAKLQSSNNIKEEVLDDMESIYNRTRDISNENSAIDFSNRFDSTLTDLLLSYKNESINIITKDLSKVEWHSISNIKKAIIYRVLQELMVNMKKHSEATIVAIKFGKEHRKITIEYNDNGKGRDIKKGNGLTNAENRMHSINGTFTFESQNNKGFTAKMTV